MPNPPVLCRDFMGAQSEPPHSATPIASTYQAPKRLQDGGYAVFIDCQEFRLSRKLILTPDPRPYRNFKLTNATIASVIATR